MFEFGRWDQLNTAYQATPWPKPRYDVIIYFRDGVKESLRNVEITPSNDFLVFESGENIWGFNRNSVRSVCMTKKCSNKEEHSPISFESGIEN